MGKILKEYYSDELFSVAFTSYSGNYMGVHETEIPILTPPSNSIEAELNETKEQGLIVLKNYSKKLFYSSVLGYLPVLLEWKNVFDGIYFIPEMYIPETITYSDISEKNVISDDEYLEKIKGKIIDRSTNTPVPYADIYYKSNNKSVVTNNIRPIETAKISQ